MLSVGRIDRSVQGHRHTGARSRALRLRAAHRHPPRRPHAHGDRDRPSRPTHAHPFTAGEDFCLVHNGSLSNPYSVRRKLEPHGIHFETDNDTEAACRFLEWRMREGDDLETALRKGLRRARRLLHVPDGHAGRAGAGARRVRLQAGRRRRDRRLRRDLVRVPLARASARRQARATSSSRNPEEIYAWKSADASTWRDDSRCGELNQYLHHELRRTRGRARARLESRRRAQHRRRRRCADRHRHPRPRRLLRGRHEQAGARHRARQRRPGVAENMMSGRVRVKGFASDAAGASGHGGLLVIEGDASLRCGISMKGGDIVVGGSVGHFSAFMAQAGRLVVCGDAGDALGDSLYEAVIYVRGKIAVARRRCARRADDRRATTPRSASCSPPPASTTTRASSSAWRRREPLSLERRRGPGVLMDQPIRSRIARLEESWGYDRSTSSTTSSTRRRTGCTRSAAWAPSASCRTSTIWCSSPRRCRAIRWKAIASAA